MIDKRLLFVLPGVALLAACNNAATDAGGTATGEVLEGSISDAMLPVGAVRSEPPLEDPAALAEVRSEAAEQSASAGGAADEGEAGADEPAPAAPDPADPSAGDED